MKKNCILNSIKKLSKIDSGKFNNIAVGVQAYITSIALLLAGWQYFALHKSKRAMLELEKLHGKASIELDLSSKQLPTNENCKVEPCIFISTTVSIKNTGTKYTCIKNTSYSLLTVRVSHDEDINDIIPDKGFYTDYKSYILNKKGNQTDLTPLNIDKIWVRPNTTKKISYLTKVDKPGIYHVIFQAPVSHECNFERLSKNENSILSVDNYIVAK